MENAGTPLLSRHRIGWQWIALCGPGALVCLGLDAGLAYQAATVPGYVKPDEFTGFVVALVVLLVIAIAALLPVFVRVELYPDRLVRRTAFSTRTYYPVEFSTYKRAERKTWIHPIPVALHVVGYTLYDRNDKPSLHLRNNMRDFAKVEAWVKERVAPKQPAR